MSRGAWAARVAGDVRAGSANRVAAAGGDGALATRFVHALLDG